MASPTQAHFWRFSFTKSCHFQLAYQDCHQSRSIAYRHLSFDVPICKITFSFSNNSNFVLIVKFKPVPEYFFLLMVWCPQIRFWTKSRGYPLLTPNILTCDLLSYLPSFIMSIQLQFGTSFYYTHSLKWTFTLVVRKRSQEIKDNTHQKKKASVLLTSQLLFIWTVGMQEQQLIKYALFLECLY